ncbi:hypothetical protein PL78_05165 [Yersinia entomophaga]|uniref:Bile acid:sodium symporter n=1 Tax=Yersinia entomophaga TaxID=935293 RepID=A0ABN4PPV0_YERET|nr:hypothetical protein PL78_05165 [Yersinia entomophaga]
MSWLQRLRIDTFLLVLIGVVIIASFFPCEGETKVWFERLTTAAIALLFFMHGAKLSRAAIVAGMGHWKLHLVVFLSTFALFPLLGLGMNVLVPGILTPTLYLGFLYPVRLACHGTIGDCLYLGCRWKRGGGDL